MPIHDWTRVPSGLIHHFHQDRSIEIACTLNRGRLPKGCARSSSSAPDRATPLCCPTPEPSLIAGQGKCSWSEPGRCGARLLLVERALPMVSDPEVVEGPGRDPGN